MLYLITPDGFVSHSDVALGDALLEAKHGRPLATQGWETDISGLPAETVLAVALRHGTDAEVGLMVHGGFVDQALEPEHLRAAQRNQSRLAAQLESIAPEPRFEDRDWHRQQRAWADEARKAADEALANAEKSANELLQAPVKEHLTTAWRRAGGLVPAS